MQSGRELHSVCGVLFRGSSLGQGHVNWIDHVDVDPSRARLLSCQAVAKSARGYATFCSGPSAASNSGVDDGQAAG